MANNTLIFDGAVAGATGGIHERWITSVNQSSYVDIRNLIVSFAQQVDALIPADPSINLADQALIQSICAGVLAERYPSSVNLSDLPRAVATLYQAMRGQLIPVTDNTLSNVRYVDRNTTVPTALQNGSISFPYTTITQAIASLPTGGVIQATPGDYSSEGTLVFPFQNFTLQSYDPHPNYVFGLGGAERIIVSAINGVNTLNLIGVDVLGTLTTVGGLSLDSCMLSGTVNALFIDGFDSRFFNTAPININTGMSLTDCRLDASVINCSAAGISRFIDCELNTSFSFTSAPTGGVFIDGRTNFFLQNVAGTITNATLTVQATPGSNVRQPTPIAASGALGTVDISAIESGGVVIFQPSANFNIDAFTSKPAGFWFDVFVDSTNQTLIGTLNQEVGSATATNRIRNPNNQPYQMVCGQPTRMRYILNRWRVGSPPTPVCNATIQVAVPALAAGVLGYVDVSLVGSAIAGPLANTMVIAEPQADLAAAGAGNGFYIGGRMSATNIFRMAFVGTLVGGNVNFTFTRL